MQPDEGAHWQMRLQTYTVVRTRGEADDTRDEHTSRAGI